MIRFPFSMVAEVSRGRHILRIGALLLAGFGLGAGNLAGQVNFGSVAVGTTASATQTVTLTPGAGEGGAIIGSMSVVTGGAPFLDFTNAGGGTCVAGQTLNAGQSCTVVVNFTPRYPGPRYGAVDLVSNLGTLIATGYVQGTGVGPQAVFANSTSGVYLPGKQSTVSGSNEAFGVAVDGSGNLYFADGGNHSVDEVEAVDGIIPASPTIRTLSSGFEEPYGVAVDGAGNVFVADYNDGTISEILAINGSVPPTSPTILTIGSGFYETYGLAVDGSGNVFVAQNYQGGVKEILAAGGYSTVKTLLSGTIGPYGVAVDGSGDVFVADYFNSAVKEILAVNGSIPASPVVKTLGSGFGAPTGVAVDASGNVYVADDYYGLYEILAEGGYTTVNTLGAGLKAPFGVAVDQKGNLFVASEDPGSTSVLDFATPPSLSFAATHEGLLSTDSPQTVTVQNIGNAPLDFSAINYPVDFPEAAGVATDCTSFTSLAAAGNCTLSVEFSPLPSSLVGAGTTLYERVSLTDNALNQAGAVQSAVVNGHEIAGEPAAITSPVNKSALTGPTATFSWTTGLSVTQYSLHVGTMGAGSTDVFGGTVAGQSQTVTGIPTTGATLYVQLGSLISGTWEYVEYTYTEAQPAEVATLTSPAFGTTILTSSTVVFSWTTGTQVTGYDLHVGTTGAGSTNIFGGDVSGQTKTVTGIPTTGGTLYVRLYSQIDGAWEYVDYTYTEASPAAPATITSPTPSSTLTGSTATFSWTTGSQVTQYSLHVGTTGAGSDNIYGGPGANESQSVTGIPTAGGTVYVRLYSFIAGAWQYIDYTYTEENAPAPAAATMISPTPGSTLPQSYATFTWTAGVQVKQYSLHVGTTGPGSTDVFGGTVAGQSQYLTDLPIFGRPLYVRLYSLIGTTWLYNDYTYTENPDFSLENITSPAPGSTLPGSTVQFSWSGGGDYAYPYSLKVGTTGPGSEDVYSGNVSGSSQTVTGIPTTGGTLYVRLYSVFYVQINGRSPTYAFIDYTYTEQ